MFSKKTQILVALSAINLIALIKAGHDPGKNIFEEFKQCQKDPKVCGAEAACCVFRNEDFNLEGNFCIETSYRKYYKNGATHIATTGDYIDDQHLVWTYTCPKVEKPPTAEQQIKDQVTNQIETIDKMSLNTAGEQWFELILWVVYLSGCAGVLGYFIEIPLGGFAEFYLEIVALWGFGGVILEGKSFSEWWFGAFRRAVVQEIAMLLLNLITLVPFGNIFLSPLIGLFAVTDFYDYHYNIKDNEFAQKFNQQFKDGFQKFK